MKLRMRILEHAQLRILYCNLALFHVIVRELFNELVTECSSYIVTIPFKAPLEVQHPCDAFVLACLLIEFLTLVLT
jgi:hypothetical protein